MIYDTHVDPHFLSHLDGILTNSNKHIINTGRKVSDLHINYAH